MSDVQGMPASEQADPTAVAEPTNAQMSLPVGAKVPRRRGRTAVVTAVILLLVAIAGVAWVNYVRSPSYSLGMLAKAAQDRDWVGVEKYVDVDAAVGQAVDAAVAQGLTGDTSGFGGLVAGLAEMKPALVQQVKDSLKKSVESGQVPLGGSPGVAAIFTGKQVKSVTYVGTEALVTVEVPQKTGAPFDMRLKMKRVDDFWRITAIENILELPGISVK